MNEVKLVDKKWGEGVQKNTKKQKQPFRYKKHISVEK